jgi:hypothetical protein
MMPPHALEILSGRDRLILGYLSVLDDGLDLVIRLARIEVWDRVTVGIL